MNHSHTWSIFIVLHRFDSRSHVAVNLRTEFFSALLLVEERTHFTQQSFFSVNRIVFRLERFHRDVECLQLAHYIVWADVVVMDNQRRLQRQNSFGAQRTMITDSRKLLDFRRIRARIVHAHQVRLCSQGINHLVVRLANAYDPLLRTAGRLLILKASAAAQETYGNKHGDYRSANHRATNVLQNTRTSRLLHLIVVYRSAYSCTPAS